MVRRISVQFNDANGDCVGSCTPDERLKVGDVVSLRSRHWSGLTDYEITSIKPETEKWTDEWARFTATVKPK
jgi:hypothetical protein